MSFQANSSIWKKHFLLVKKLDVSNTHLDKLKKAVTHGVFFPKSFEEISKNEGGILPHSRPDWNSFAASPPWTCIRWKLGLSSKETGCDSRMWFRSKTRSNRSKVNKEYQGKIIQPTEIPREYRRCCWVYRAISSRLRVSIQKHPAHSQLPDQSIRASRVDFPLFGSHQVFGWTERREYPE